MKRFFGFALVSLMATAAHAGSLTFDGRFDYMTTTPAAGAGYSGFQVSRAQLDYQGAAAKAKFRAKVNLLSNSSATNDGDGTTSFINFAYAGTEVANGWDLNMGRVILGMGGVEATNNAGDNYARSLAGNEVARLYWQGGVQAEGKVGDGKVTITLANNSVANTTNQTTMMTGLAWFGKMGDLQPVISYHMEKFATAAGVAYDNKFMAVGLRYVTSSWELEADYLDNKYDGTEMLDSSGALSSKHTNSIPVLFRYKMGDNSVLFKYEMSKNESATAANAYDYTSMGLAYEAGNAKKDGFRWHVAYGQADTKATTTTTNKSLLVGMRVLADFLK